LVAFDPVAQMLVSQYVLPDMCNRHGLGSTPSLVRLFVWQIY